MQYLQIILHGVWVCFTTMRGQRAEDEMGLAMRSDVGAGGWAREGSLNTIHSIFFF